MLMAKKIVILLNGMKILLFIFNLFYLNENFHDYEIHSIFTSVNNFL